MSIRTQKDRMMALHTPLGDDVLLINSLSGTEGLGRLFNYDVEATTEKNDIDFDKLLGQGVSVSVNDDTGKTRWFHGIVSRITQTSEATAVTRLELTIVPWFWALTRASDCRIFQELTVPEIIAQVFRDRGFSDFEDKLGETYDKWTYCVQYRETDFNFISRLMEQEGISYYFKHEEGKHILVLADGQNSHVAIPEEPTLPFHPPAAGAAVRGAHIDTWTVRALVQPGVYALSDFDFCKPKTDLESKTANPRTHAHGDYEIFDYPGEYDATKEGERFSKIRLQELQAQHEQCAGATDCRFMTCGGTFTLEDPNTLLRPDQLREYLVTGCTYHIKQDPYDSGAGNDGDGDAFTCSFDAIPTAVPFRPARTTPKPIIQGPQTAMVVGPSGEEIHTDEHGRVRVKFHWDRYGQTSKGDTSCWMRVAQVWAGKKWGGMFIPRVGHEVIVEFLEGDPDQPIVTGRVYNGEAKPPYDLPANKTMSTLKSLSSKGGGGFNEIRFEDKKGEEHLFVHAEKDMHQRVKEKLFTLAKIDAHEIVEQDRFLHVKNERHETIDNAAFLKVGRDCHVEITGNRNEKIGQALSLKVTSGSAMEVGGSYWLKADGGIGLKTGATCVIDASGGITLKCGGSSVVIDASGVTIKGPSVVLDGNMVRIASGPGSPPLSAIAGTLTAPTAPKAAEEAMNADPGELTELQSKTRERQAKESQSKEGTESPPLTWIGIELVDDQGKPVPGQPYKLKLPNGTIVGGTLDDQGKANVRGIPEGQCEVCFPTIHGDEWKAL